MLSCLILPFHVFTLPASGFCAFESLNSGGRPEVPKNYQLRKSFCHLHNQDLPDRTYQVAYARLPRFEILGQEGDVSRVTSQTAAPTFQQIESNLSELSFSPLTDNHHTGNVYGVKNGYSEGGEGGEMK